MIRRSPTRIELKLEDLTDFDYIQKFDKKKAPNAVPGTVGGISAADAQKFMRQDRIGFRPIRGGAPTTAATGGGSGGSGTGGSTYQSGSNNANTVVPVDVLPGVMTAEASTTTVEVIGFDGNAATSTNGTGASRSNNVADMDTSGDDREVVTSSSANFTVGSNASNVDMSLDESL